MPWIGFKDQQGPAKLAEAVRDDGARGPRGHGRELTPLVARALRLHLENGGILLFMRVAIAGFVALLALHVVDEQFFGARYTQAAVMMLSQIVRSFG